MKLCYIILPSFIALSLMTGCSKGNQLDDIDPEYFPVKLAGEKSWGMMSKDGEILFESEFKNCPSTAYNGIFAVREGKGYSLYYADAKPRLVSGCDNLKATGLFVIDDYAPVVREGKRITVINRDGEEMYTLSPQKGKEIIYASSFFSDGMLIVQNEEGKYGAFNHDGELTVSCKYDNLQLFNDGYSVASSTDKDNNKTKYQIIDHNGNVVNAIKTCKSVRSLIYDGKCIICLDDERYAFITVDGDVVKCPKEVKDVVEFNGKYLIYRGEGDCCGLLEYDDAGGEVLIKASKYDYIIPFNKSWSKFLANMGDEYRLIDREGETLDKFEDYKSMSVLSQSAETIIAQEGNYYVVLDSKGKVINKKLDIESMSFGDYHLVLSDLPKVRDTVKAIYPVSNYYYSDDESLDSTEQILAPTQSYLEEEEVVVETPAEVMYTDDYNYYQEAEAAAVETAAAAEPDYYDYPAAE